MTTAVDQNYLRSNNFAIIIPGLENLSNTITDCPVPGITHGDTFQPTPMLDAPVTGGKLTFGPINMQFKLQEGMANYKEAYNWLMMIGDPRSLEAREEDTSNYFKDVTIQIYDTNRNPASAIKLSQAFPTELGEIPFNTQDSEEVMVSLTLRYSYMDFELSDLYC